MAFTRLSLSAFSLLLLSLLAIVSAGDYGNYDSSKYGYDGIPADSPHPKPEEEAEPKYGRKPDSYPPKPDDKPTQYETKEDNYQPKQEGEDHDHKPKLEEEAKTNYGAKPDSYKPNPEEKPTQYDIKDDNYQPKPEGEEYNDKPKPEEKEKFLPIAIEGTVLCKSGSKYHPIQGALAKVTCQAVDKIGLVKPIPICMVPTDEKGYFFATLPSLSDLVDQHLNLKDCKAFLEGSPLETCNVPTDVNKGISGAPFTRYGILKEKHTKLYSVGPFFYTPAAEPVPNNGY